MTPMEPAGTKKCDEFSARDRYEQDNVQKEVMHDIKQLQDGLTSRAERTFSQNDSKVQETSKYRDEDEANKQ